VVFRDDYFGEIIIQAICSLADFVMQELMSGQDPYTEYSCEVDASEAISAVKLPVRPDQFVDEEMWNLCLRIWQGAREKRPSMDGIFEQYEIRFFKCSPLIP
jgi:hypothetical protein